MANFSADRFAARGRWDGPLAAAILLAAALGLVALYSASWSYAECLGREPGSFALRQCLFLAVGAVAFALCAIVPLERLSAATPAITLASLASLGLTFLPGIGVHVNGASRWINLGFTTFQPSELWKLSSVLYLAWILAKRYAPPSALPHRAGLDAAGGAPRGSAWAIAPLFLACLGAATIYLQNDFSTAVLALTVALAMFWIAGLPFRFFAAVGSVALPLGALSVLTSDFRLRRIMAFLNPGYDPLAHSYQVLGSIRAIRAGGFIGKGVGLGTLKISSVPEVQSDFILASVAEETGFLGIAAVVGLWAFICSRAFRAAFREEDPYRSYLAFGLGTLLAVQVLVNVAVASGFLPATGLPLPFFSAAGSSVVVTAAVCGLVANLARRAPVEKAGAKGGADA